MKKKLFTGLILTVISFSLFGAKVTQKQCNVKTDGSYIFAGGECIQYAVFKGDKKGFLNIIVHGTWKEGTNILARYAPFAQTININTDITTLAVALPGYSKSSTNYFSALSHDKTKNLATDKKYIEFLGKLIEKLKEKYKAKIVTYIGHSAGAAMGATLSGMRPLLANNYVLAGGKYKSGKKGTVHISEYLDKLNKNTKYILVYGTKDRISKPKITLDFYKIAKKQGLNVELVRVKGAKHLDLDMSDPSVEAITRMLDNYNSIM
ncbi:MAG: alpha/beta hydrolase [Sulfurospirillum sp.]